MEEVKEREKQIENGSRRKRDRCFIGDEREAEEKRGEEIVK